MIYNRFFFGEKLYNFLVSTFQVQSGLLKPTSAIQVMQEAINMACYCKKDSKSFFPSPYVLFSHMYKCYFLSSLFFISFFLYTFFINSGYNFLHLFHSSLALYYKPQLLLCNHLGHIKMH